MFSTANGVKGYVGLTFAAFLKVLELGFHNLLVTAVSEGLLSSVQQTFRRDSNDLASVDCLLGQLSLVWSLKKHAHCLRKASFRIAVARKPCLIGGSNCLGVV